MSKVCEIWKIAGFFRETLSSMSEAVTASKNVDIAHDIRVNMCMMHNKTGDKRKEPRIASRLLWSGWRDLNSRPLEPHSAATSCILCVNPWILRILWRNSGNFLYCHTVWKLSGCHKVAKRSSRFPSLDCIWLCHCQGSCVADRVTP